MHPKRMAATAGLSVLALCSIAALSAARGSGAGRAATDQPRFVNAKVETRAAGPALEATVDGILRAQATPSWFGYVVPAVSRQHHMCDSDRRPARAYLEGRPPRREADERDAAAAEGSQEMVVLFRAAGGKIQKVRTFSVDCELDAGGLPVVWLTGARPPESVSMLRGMVTRESEASEASEQSALMALALHADASAGRALERFVAAGQPPAVRKRAAFWLGSARGEEGFQVLRRLLQTESDQAFRRELVFPISLSRNPEATDTLIQLARRDSNPDVRKQAMFWLGQKAGSRTAATLADVAASDPDTDVKKRAVFALSRMPGDEGVPRLIEVARSNRNPEVRRQAMFWLGQSNDARALAYLEEVLKK
jgi:hypothetical protein